MISVVLSFAWTDAWTRHNITATAATVGLPKEKPRDHSLNGYHVFHDVQQLSQLNLGLGGGGGSSSGAVPSALD
jgi:hypothetical protein